MDFRAARGSPPLGEAVETLPCLLVPELTATALAVSSLVTRAGKPYRYAILRRPLPHCHTATLLAWQMLDDKATNT